MLLLLLLFCCLLEMWKFRMGSSGLRRRPVWQVGTTSVEEFTAPPEVPFKMLVTMYQTITQIVSIFTNFKRKYLMKCDCMWFQTLWTAMSLKSAATGLHTLRTRTAWKYTFQLMITSTACLVCGARTSWEASLLSGLAADSVMNQMKFHLFDSLYPSPY